MDGTNFSKKPLTTNSVQSTDSLSQRPVFKAASSQPQSLPAKSSGKISLFKVFKNTKVLFLALVATLVVALALAIFSFIQYRGNQKIQKQLKKNQNTVSPSQQVIEQVGKLMVLPGNETPTVATVTDLEKLKGQVFFAKAQIGDKVLIYTQAKKAILYNPASNKIVEVAPLNLDNTGSNPQHNLKSSP